MSKDNATLIDTPVTGAAGAEETAFQAILEQLDETGGRISQSLGRIHGLMQDIVGELQMARGVSRSKAE